MENRKRYIQIKFRVDKEEKKKIDGMIKLAKVTKERYLRHMAMYGVVYKKDMETVNRLAYQVKKIGDNVNQVAKYVNSSFEIKSEDMMVLEKSIKDLWQLLRSTLLNHR